MALENVCLAETFTLDWHILAEIGDFAERKDDPRLATDWHGLARIGKDWHGLTRNGMHWQELAPTGRPEETKNDPQSA